MNLPPLALDLAGGLCVLVSLYYLWGKASMYWHWSNASLVPYFLLFLAGGQWMLAGLQVTYLLFGIHGLYLWHLEARRARGEIRFNEAGWYGVTWAASGVIFAYTVLLTDFGDVWNGVQFAAVTLALIANFGTTRSSAFSHALIVGKFAPFHRGHRLLLERALAECERVSVWVYSRPDFAGMPSPLRRNWIRELFPARLFPGLELLPDAPNPPPNDEPDAVHRAYVRTVLDDWGVHPDAVYTSEDYGDALAAELGAAHVCVDRAREIVPISGTQLRADIHAHRQFLDPAIYAHFVGRVVLLGAESTGKSTLTRALAESFGTTSAREYGRDVYEREDGKLSPEHFLEIARGHRALEDEAARTPGVHRYVFCDTHAATTLMWSYLMTGTALPELHALADACRTRYAHTFLCADDLAHEQDGWRANTEVRTVQQAFVRQDLGTRGVAFQELRGDVAARTELVRAALGV